MKNQNFPKFQKKLKGQEMIDYERFSSYEQSLYGKYVRFLRNVKKNNQNV